MNIYLQCAECHEDIKAFNVEVRGGNAYITVNLCERCKEELVDEAREEGYNAGFDDGFI